MKVLKTEVIIETTKFHKTQGQHTNNSNQQVGTEIFKKYILIVYSKSKINQSLSIYQNIQDLYAENDRC